MESAALSTLERKYFKWGKLKVQMILLEWY